MRVFISREVTKPSAEQAETAKAVSLIFKSLGFNVRKALAIGDNMPTIKVEISANSVNADLLITLQKKIQSKYNKDYVVLAKAVSSKLLFLVVHKAMEISVAKGLEEGDVG